MQHVAHPTPIFAEFTLRWPSGAWDWALFAGFAVVAVLAIVVYLRDARKLHPLVTAWLTLLRLATIAALLVIALNPSDRTSSSEPIASRVLFLVDVSSSMDNPEKGGDVEPIGGSHEARKRSQAVLELFEGTPMFAELKKYHDVAVYTFDKQLSKDPVYTAESEIAARAKAARENKSNAKDGTDESQAAAAKDNANADPWQRLRKPEGRETALAAALRELMQLQKGRTLSAVVLISDGQSNSGISYKAARQYALKNKVRLYTVGVGSTRPPVNLRIAEVQHPTEVNKGEPFDVTAFLQGSGTEGRDVKVKLKYKPRGAPDDQYKEVEEETANDLLKLGKDGTLTERVFQIKPQEPGQYHYVIEVRPNFAVKEFRTDDNQRDFMINVVERNMGVLLLAGGPMRDYRFVRNMLYRHKNIDVDVWLQTVDPRIARDVSQDADDILTAFPDSFPTRPKAIREGYTNDPDTQHAIQYDVVIAFDPDWTSAGIPPDGLKKLEDWISKQAGGLIAVAGEVNTPRLISAPELETIRNLYPVAFSQAIVLGGEAKSETPRAFTPTEAGRRAAFLQLSDDEAESQRAWNDFEGFYRAYPTEGQKASAVIYSYFNDPNFSEPPILFAFQNYGIGRVLYFGTSETWRLRSEDVDYYDRLWLKAVRHVGQGRLSRQSPFGTLTRLDEKYFVGDTARVEASLLDANNNPLQVPKLPLIVIDPRGEPLKPQPVLEPDETRPGFYLASFPVRYKGSYQLRVNNPAIEGQKPITEIVPVEVSFKERRNPTQNAALLTDLARDTGGKYLPLDEFAGKFSSIADKQKAIAEMTGRRASASKLQQAEEQLKALREELKQMFPDRGYTMTVNERTDLLWDTRWMMFLIVSLLSVEWLTRKLLKLA